MRRSLVLTSVNELSANAKSSLFSQGNIILYGAVSLLLFGPLAFGAVEPWSTFVLEAGAAALFALWAFWQASQQEVRILWSPVFLPMLGFALLIAGQWLLGKTAYLAVTRSQAMLYCAYGMLAFLLVQGLRKTAQLQLMAWLFSAYGLAVAVFALLQSFSPNGKIYWYRTLRHGGWIYGPYVNHNHYAGLMEMLVPIPLVLSLLSSIAMRWRITAAAAAALMASTIFLCGSRGGMLSLVLELTLLVALLVRRKKSRQLALVLGIFLAFVAGTLTWLGGGELTSRIESIDREAHTELSGGVRLTIDRDGIRMFRQKPVLGWGLGTFPTVYPKYRSFYTNVFINEAHDDYLQLLIEMGALGFAVMLWFVAVTYYYGAKKLPEWTRDPNGTLALAAILGVTGIMVHSFVDFNLQIPSNAALFYCLCAVAAMEPRFSPTGRRRQRRFPERFETELSA